MLQCTEMLWYELCVCYACVCMSLCVCARADGREVNSSDGVKLIAVMA